MRPDELLPLVLSCASESAPKLGWLILAPRARKLACIARAPYGVCALTATSRQKQPAARPIRATQAPTHFRSLRCSVELSLAVAMCAKPRPYTCLWSPGTYTKCKNIRRWTIAHSPKESRSSSCRGGRCNPGFGTGTSTCENSDRQRKHRVQRLHHPEGSAPPAGFVML